MNTKAKVSTLQKPKLPDPARHALRAKNYSPKSEAAYISWNYRYQETMDSGLENRIIWQFFLNF